MAHITVLSSLILVIPLALAARSICPQHCPKAVTKEYTFQFNVTFSPNRRPKLSKGSSQQLLKMYSGLFRKKITQPDLAGKWKFSISSVCKYLRISCLRNVGCIPNYSDHIKTQMRNTEGKLRDLVHLDALGMYQYVQVAKCPKTKCRNGGPCVATNTTQYLLVYAPEHDFPIVFESFSVATCCSCQLRIQ